MRYANSPYSYGGLYGAIRDMYNIHPSRHDYKVQKFFAGFVPGYGQYMEGKAQDEWAQSQMDALDLNWNDIKSPWIAGLSGGNTQQAVGSAMHQVSRNIMDLYSSASDSTHDAKKRRWMEKQYRADFRR